MKNNYFDKCIIKSFINLFKLTKVRMAQLQVLCMGRNYYGVYWKSLGSSYFCLSCCSWFTRHSTDIR